MVPAFTQAAGNSHFLVPVCSVVAAHLLPVRLGRGDIPVIQALGILLLVEGNRRDVVIAQCQAVFQHRMFFTDIGIAAHIAGGLAVGGIEGTDRPGSRQRFKVVLCVLRILVTQAAGEMVKGLVKQSQSTTGGLFAGLLVQESVTDIRIAVVVIHSGDAGTEHPLHQRRRKRKLTVAAIAGKPALAQITFHGFQGGTGRADSDCTRRRRLTVERALGPAQDFELGQVVLRHIDAAGGVEKGAIQVGGHPRADWSREVGTDPAQYDIRVEAVAADIEARDQTVNIGEVEAHAVLKVTCGDHIDRHRDIAQGLGALLCGDNDLLQNLALTALCDGSTAGDQTGKYTGNDTRPEGRSWGLT